MFDNFLFEVRYFFSNPSVLWRDIKNATVKKWKLGFNPNETWSLDYSITKFVLPRLKYFRKTAKAHPACLETPEEWNVILDSMIAAFDLMVDEDSNWDFDKKKMKIVKKGMDNFHKYFHALWW